MEVGMDFQVAGEL